MSISTQMNQCHNFSKMLSQTKEDSQSQADHFSINYLVTREFINSSFFKMPKSCSHSKNPHLTQKKLLLSLASSLIILVSLSLASPIGDIQPPNQPPPEPISTQQVPQLGAGQVSLAQNAPNSGEVGSLAPSAQTSVATQQQLAQSGQQQPQQHQFEQQQSLPNINIYINKNEIKKLLGIETRINYVTNGNINTYPLGFTIPLGYNQSDIIFTWQNLGQTNVNYSISLVIGNIEAVEQPIINITRAGLIPKHEQVFKITLPCSGKVTDEVDVQVLIQILGQLENQQEDQQEQQIRSASGADSDNSSDSNATLQSANKSPETSGNHHRTRLVTHTLAIKRKKICTMHPTPVHPRISPQPPQLQRNQPQDMQPMIPNRWPQPQANVPAALPTPPPPQIQSSGQNAGSTDHSMKQELPRIQTNGHYQAIGNDFSQQDQQNHQPALPHPHPHHPHRNQQQTEDQLDSDPLSLEQNTHKLGLLNLIPPPARSLPEQNGPAPSLPWYPNWPQQIRGIPANNPLNDIIAANNRQQQQQSVLAAASGAGPLVLTLVAVSLLISLALLVVLLLGSGGGSISSSGSGSHKAPPFDKLATLTSCLLRRTPASRAKQNKCKSPMVAANGVIGSLRLSGSTKPLHSGITAATSTTIATTNHLSSANSSLSGLSAIINSTSGSASNGGGGGGQKSPASYCYKTNCSGYYTTGHQQHHYQHPPTADLLGTGYQACNQHQLQQQYPIYHIATGSNSHTTRLRWNNGNGTSPDGFIIDGGSYMPLSNAPKSDHSSNLYQTIY